MSIVRGNQDESATFLTAKPPVKTFLLATQHENNADRAGWSTCLGRKAYLPFSCSAGHVW